jgi:ABC-type transport system involved in cytochrome c biogenesis permease subunit
MIENLIKTLLGTSGFIYVLAFAFLVTRRRQPGIVLFVVGWLLNGAVFCLNWLVGGEPPFGNMYHVLIFLGLSFLPLYLFLAQRYKLSGLMHYFAFAAILPMIGSFFMSRDVHWRRMPALQSHWFVPHVFSYMVSYALAALAFFMIAINMLRRSVLKGADQPSMHDASYQVARLAFPFMTFGLLSGALWAEEAWGRYWSWDPKETWALITWLMYLVYFHCRKHADLRKIQDWMQVLAFLALLSTFILVNILPKFGSALHSYAVGG